MARMVSWFDRTPDDGPVSCDGCGWSGFGRDLEPDYDSGYLLERSCPVCDRHLELAAYPDDAEISARAESGNEEAQAELPAAQRRQQRSALPVAEDVGVFPDLPVGAGRVIAIEVVEDDADPLGPWVVVRSGEVELWREPAFWEDPAGGRRLMNLLWTRYAGRIDRLELEGWALDYFAGDRISGAYEFLALQDGPQEG